MKKIFGLILMASLFIGCEDVIEVDVPDTPPRLSIDGLVRLDASRALTTVTIRASLTSSFFGQITPAELTSISINNPDYVPTSALDSRVVTLFEVSPGMKVNCSYLFHMKISVIWH